MLFNVPASGPGGSVAGYFFFFYKPYEQHAERSTRHHKTPYTYKSTRARGSVAGERRESGHATLRDHNTRGTLNISGPGESQSGERQEGQGGTGIAGYRCPTHGVYRRNAGRDAEQVKVVEHRQRPAVERCGQGGAAGVGDLGAAKAEQLELLQPSGWRRLRTCLWR